MQVEKIDTAGMWKDFIYVPNGWRNTNNRGLHHADVSPDPR